MFNSIANILSSLAKNGDQSLDVSNTQRSAQRWVCCFSTPLTEHFIYSLFNRAAWSAPKTLIITKYLHVHLCLRHFSRHFCPKRLTVTSYVKFKPSGRAPGVEANCRGGQTPHLTRVTTSSCDALWPKNTFSHQPRDMTHFPVITWDILSSNIRRVSRWRMIKSFHPYSCRSSAKLKDSR